MIKKYNRARYREKFRRYRLFFLLTAIVFLCALIAEMLWGGDFGLIFEKQKTQFSAFFSNLFTREMTSILILFLFGVTVYAPVFGFLYAAARGVFSGFCISVLLSAFEGKRDLWLLTVTALYLLLSAWLSLSYSTFCITTALQMYAKPSVTQRSGNFQMYGGTLFYSSLSGGRVNLRFLSSYCLFFLAACFFLFLLVLGFSALRSTL